MVAASLRPSALAAIEVYCASTGKHSFPIMSGALATLSCGAPALNT